MEYERLIAPVISFNAFRAYNQSQYLLCRRLLERNIASGEATADDRVLLSQAMMRLSGSDEEDEKALAVVRKVTGSKTEVPLGAFKQEAILLLRLGRGVRQKQHWTGMRLPWKGREQKYSSHGRRLVTDAQLPGSEEGCLTGADNRHQLHGSEMEWISLTRGRSQPAEYGLLQQK